MDDPKTLCERLRSWSRLLKARMQPGYGLALEAAERIEDLEAEVDRLAKIVSGQARTLNGMPSADAELADAIAFADEMGVRDG